MHKALRYTIAVVCLILSGVVGTTVLVLNSMAAPRADEPILLEPVQRNEKVNVLILGTDEGLLPGGIKASTRTDTMMVASFDPNTLKVNVISLPRDSRVDIPGREKMDKINSAHAYGGVQLAVATVQKLMDIPIHYFVRVDHSGFQKVIDAIGGVDYYVEFDMDYEDPYQDLYIHLVQGQQKLDGDKAEQYVRYRGGDSDISRIRRQQKFLVAAIKTVLKPANLLRVNTLIDIARRSVYTNIDAADALKYLPYIDKITSDSVSMLMIPGEIGNVNGGSYWLIDHEEMDVLLKEHFWEDIQDEPSEVSIDITDASGKDIGEEVAESLRRRGFNVVSVDTGEAVAEKTRITAHESNDAAGLMVYRVLRQGDVYKEKTARATSVSIILGSDFNR